MKLKSGILAFIALTLTLSCKSNQENNLDISIEVYQVYNNTEISNSILEVISIITKETGKPSTLTPNISFSNSSVPSSGYIGYANKIDIFSLNDFFSQGKFFPNNSKTLWLPGFDESGQFSNLILIKNNKVLTFKQSDLRYIKLNPRNSGLKKMMGMPQNPTSFSLEISLKDDAIKSIQSNLLSDNQNNSTLIVVCKIGNSVLHTEILLPDDKLNDVQFMNPLDINLKNQIETEFSDLCKK